MLEDNTQKVVAVSKDNYYVSATQKITDFLMGFLSAGLFMFLSFKGYLNQVGWFILVIFFIFVFLGAFFSKKGRKFITLGIIFGILILPLLLFGSCFFKIPGIN